MSRAGSGSRGFTLLELLVAMAIFSIMAALAYGGLSSVLNSSDGVEREAERLRNLQQVLLLLERDFDQLTLRDIRDEYGDRQPAFRGGQDWIEFTRGGWSNPAGQPRSSLQRIAYTQRERRLVRAYWYVLDRAQDSAPLETELLNSLDLMQLRYLDEAGRWISYWPVENPSAQVAPLPRAIELQLDDLHWGRITRLFVLR